MGIHGIPSDPKNATHVMATIHPVRAQLPGATKPAGAQRQEGLYQRGCLHSQAET